MKTGLLTVMRAGLVAAFIVVGVCAPFSASEAKERDVLVAENLSRIEDVIKTEVDDGVRAGFVAAIATRKGVVYTAAAGMADPYNKVPMGVDTRFRIASMTKPVVTAAVMQLIDRGVLRLNDPVSLYIPAYKDARVATSTKKNKKGGFDTRPASRPITIHDLLTHTAGIGYVFDSETDLGRAYLEVNDIGGKGALGDRVNQIAALPLYNDPGAEWRYSYAIDILGYVIEIVSGITLEEYMQKNIFAPLGMTDTEFFVDESDFGRLAVVNAFNEDGKMVLAGPDDVSPNVNETGFGVMSGGAGLISTAHDYTRFCMMMLNEGTLDGARILSPATVRLMMSDHTPFEARPDGWKTSGVTFGLGGLVVLEPGYTGEIAAPGEWGWSGYWDTWFIVDPKDGIAAILMAQTQPGPNVPPSRARDLVKSIAYGALRN